MKDKVSLSGKAFVGGALAAYRSFLYASEGARLPPQGSFRRKARSLRRFRCAKELAC